MDQPDRNKGAKRTPTIHSMLEDLATTDSSISFIYSALELLATHYEIDDAAIVLSNDVFGTQIFRLAGRAVSAELIATLGSQPGVYCTPDVVPRAELDEVYYACQQAFSSQHLRYSAAQGVPIRREAPRSDAEAPAALIAQSRSSLADKMSTTIEQLRALRRNRTLTDRSRDGLAGKTATAIEYIRTLRPNRTTYGQSVRSRLSQFLVLVDIASFAMTVGDVHGPLRLVLGLLLGMVIPGWCVVGPLKLDNPPLEIGLTLAVSLSLLMIIAQILMTIDLWHLGALEDVICVVCLPSLIVQARTRSFSGRHAR
jgi:hypothetical protein